MDAIYTDSPNREEPKVPAAKKHSGLLLQLVTWIVFLAILAGSFLNLRIIITSGPSMEPTYTQGDVVLFLKRYTQPKEGDVVLLQKNGTWLVKRVQQVNESGVYVIGDNPDESWDSRSEDFGLVPIQDIWGYGILTLIDK